MRIKYARKISILLLFIELQQTFSFHFFLLRHNYFFELVQQFYHAAEIGRPNAANVVSAYADQPQQTK